MTHTHHNTNATATAMLAPATTTDPLRATSCGLYAYTGGKAYNASLPTVVMIHGVLNDHSVWILQSRYLAHHGWNVLAIDLPGHAKSSGTPPRSVDEAVQVIRADLQSRGLSNAHARVALVGHSFGSLIALAYAAQYSDEVSHLCLVGTAFPMRVSPALLDAALQTPDKAIQMVNTFSHATLSPPPSALGPGTWLYGASQALMRRVLRTSAPIPNSNVFHTGFQACDSYTGGEADLQAVQAAGIPTQFILGRLDQMTPGKNAQSLVALAPTARVDWVNAGHAMMSEAPDAVLFALRAFLTSTRPSV